MTACDDDDDDEPSSLESHASSSASASATPTHHRVSTPTGVKHRSKRGSFRRLSFPRDSGCFTDKSSKSGGSGSTASGGSSSTVGNPRASPAASDRSSQSGVSSHPESGVFAGRSSSSGGMKSVSHASSSSSSDEDTATGSVGGASSADVSPVKSRPAEQAAKTRTLRDRHTVVNVVRDLDSVDAPPTGTQQSHRLTHSQTMDLINRGIHTSSKSGDASKDKFDKLVEKYGGGGAGSSSRSSLDGSTSMAQFKSAKSVFERAAAAVESPSSPKKSSSGKRLPPLVASSVD